MKQLSLLAVCLFTFCVSQAQVSSAKFEKKQRYFIATILTIDKEIIKGRLYSVNDSQLVLQKLIVNWPDTAQVNDFQYIPAENIQSFYLIRKNRVLNGALIGFGAGAFVGVAAGLAAGSDPADNDLLSDPFTIIFLTIGNSLDISAGEKAIYGALSFGAGGAIAGAIVNAFKKQKFIVKGNREAFDDLQAEIAMKLNKN